MMTREVLLLAVLLFQPLWVSPQTYAPLVTMRVTTPDGTTQDISARESSVAKLTLKDGSALQRRSRRSASDQNERSFLNHGGVETCYR